MVLDKIAKNCVFHTKAVTDTSIFHLTGPLLISFNSPSNETKIT